MPLSTEKYVQPEEEIPQTEARELHFCDLFERYSRSVNYFFARRGFSPEECRDLTQETFLGVYRGIERFRSESSPKTWLFTIAANIWRNQVRRESADKRDAWELSLDVSREEQGFDPPASDAEDPEWELLERERLELLRETFDELPPKMRRCLLLRVDQSLKYREIATVMQISIQTVKSQLFQAKEFLRSRLAHHFSELDEEED